MKAKKALKRLDKIEVLVARVIDQCPARSRGLRDLLESAQASLVRAKGVVEARASRKPAGTARQATQNRRVSKAG